MIQNVLVFNAAATEKVALFEASDKYFSVGNRLYVYTKLTLAVYSDIRAREGTASEPKLP